jgi:hypothetical protein
MAIDFSGNSGTILARLGRAGAVIKNQDAYLASQNTALATALAAQLASEPDVQAIVGSGYLGVLSSAGSAAGSLMQQLAAAVANRTVYRDSPRVNQTLSSANTLASLKEIIRQMKAQGQTVRAGTVAATPTAFVGSGDAVLNGSVVRPFDGATLENSFAETVNVVCTRDSYAGSATAGNETLQASGAGSVSDVFAWNWPGGSNCQPSITCIDGSKNNSSGNKLTNSGWDTFTANVPNNWSVVSGVAGTNFQQNTGITYDGASSLQIIGDGTTNFRIRQVFGDSTTGTAGTLAALSQHSFAGWLRRDGTVPGAGTLKVSLTDGSGVVVKDAGGTDNSFTIPLTGLSTSWAASKGQFRLPLVLPTTLYLDLQLSVALTAGRSVYLDRFGLGPMSQLYTGGPFLASHSGASPLVAGDLAQLVVTNGRGAAGTLSTWQTLFFRLYNSDFVANELLLPSSIVPSITDSLIN